MLGDLGTEIGMEDKREERTFMFAEPWPASAGHTTVHEVTQSLSCL